VSGAGLKLGERKRRKRNRENTEERRYTEGRFLGIEEHKTKAKTPKA
jgi:hypothetical protein